MNKPRHGGGVWTGAGHDGPECVVHGSTCTARFESDSPGDPATHAPFDRLEFGGASVYAEPGRRPLAHLDEREQTWYSYDDRRSWDTPSMRAEQAIMPMSLYGVVELLVRRAKTGMCGTPGTICSLPLQPDSNRSCWSNGGAR